MSSQLSHVTNQLDKLKTLAHKGDQKTLEQRNLIIKKLKSAVIEFKSLPPGTQSPKPQECILARQIYQYAAFNAIDCQNIPQFQNYVKLLKFYYDQFRNIIPPSQKRHAILGLYLLSLFQQNQIAKYHMELELIPVEEHNNVYIQVPLSLQQHFVDGNYDKILSTRQNVPIPQYNYILDKFTDTVRFEMARSCEKSYDSLSLKDAYNMLMVRKESQLIDFMNSDQEHAKNSEVEWKIENGRLRFINLNEEKLRVRSQAVIDDMIKYATQIERIV